MKISKKDALMWLEFFAELPDYEEILPNQQEIILATLAQIETAVEARNEALKAQIPGLKSLDNFLREQVIAGSDILIHGDLL